MQKGTPKRARKDSPQVLDMTRTGENNQHMGHSSSGLRLQSVAENSPEIVEEWENTPNNEALTDGETVGTECEMQNEDMTQSQ